MKVILVVVTLAAIFGGGCFRPAAKDVAGIYTEQRTNATTTLELRPDSSFVQTVVVEGAPSITVMGHWQYREDQSAIVLEGAVSAGPTPIQPRAKPGQKLEGSWIMSVEKRGRSVILIDSPDEGLLFRRKDT